MITKPIAWSHTALEHAEQCLRSYHAVRVTKEFPQTQGEQLIWGNRVHAAFECALRDNAPMPEGMELWQATVEQFRRLKGTLLVEQELAITEGFQPCEWFAKDAWCRGVIDALWVDGAVAKAVDWKTGKRKPNSDQLALFALLVFHHYPQVEEVRTMFVWLKSLEVDKETFGRMHIPELWQRFIPKLRRLKNAFDTDTWPAKTSGLCANFCPVLTCPFNGRQHLNRGSTSGPVGKK